MMHSTKTQFQKFSDFISYLELLQPPSSTEQEKEMLLIKAKAFIKEHNLIPKVPIVTVTGTNGKGSTVKALEEILVNHDLNVCTFTSPHLLSYTERFSYNLQPIEEKTLLRLANTLATFIDFSQWNFFFILFFIHLLWCKEFFLDCIILEVGIGGRLDACNVLDASLVILTQVALDHTEILGDTREAIGYEKGSLLREKIFFICGDFNPPTLVTKLAEQLHCSFYQCDKDFGFYTHNKKCDLWFNNVMFCNLPSPKMHLISLSCALQAAKILFPRLRLTTTFMNSKLPSIYLPARYQQLTYGEIEVLVDVSHNPAAAQALAAFLQSLPHKHTYAIFGSKATKDIIGIITAMQDIIDSWYLVPVEHTQGITTQTLTQYFLSFSITPKTVLNVADAIQEINSKNSTDARIVIFGSFHIAGPALTFLTKKIIFLDCRSESLH